MHHLRPVVWLLPVLVVCLIALGLLTPLELRFASAEETQLLPRAGKGSGIGQLGKVGGPSYAVAVSGTHVYLGVGQRLVVLDASDPSTALGISEYLPSPVIDMSVEGGYVYALLQYNGLAILSLDNPTTPTLVRHIALVGGGHDLSLAEGYAYLAGDDRGVEIVDVRDPTTARVVGHYDVEEGAVRAVAVAGNRLYASADQGIRILDVSNPSSPTLLGHFPLNAEGPVVVSGTHLFLAAGGLHVLDVSNPAAPTEVATVPGPVFAGGVALVGSRLYVTNTELDATRTLEIYDVTTPTAPVRVGGFALQNSGRNLAISGTSAYIALYTSGLRVLDVSDPRGGIAATVDTPHTASDVAFVRSYAYVADRFSIRILDASDPLNPTEVGSSPLDSERLVVSGTHAYSLYGAAPTIFEVLDVSNPLAPAVVGTFTAPDVIRDIAVAGERVYLTLDSGSLRIVDVSNPTAPVEVGHYDFPPNATALSVAISGNYAYVSALSTFTGPDSGSGLYVLDVSNPAAPTQVYYSSHPIYQVIGDILIHGGYAYLSSISEGEVRRLDLSDPAHPVEQGAYTVSFTGDIRVQAEGNLVYLLSVGGDWVTVLDQSNPMALRQVGTFYVPGDSGAQGFALQGTTMYVADGTDGLTVLDASNPAILEGTGRYNLPDAINKMVAVGDRLFVAAGEGFYELGSSDLLRPLSVAWYPLPGPISDVVVEGQYAYVLSGLNGLSIFDISTPGAPVALAHFDPHPFLEFGRGLAVSGDYVYLANHYSGFQIVDVSDRSHPILVSSIAPFGHMEDVAIQGSIAYVVDADDGLGLYDISNPVSPTLLSLYPAQEAFREVLVADNYAYVADHGTLTILNVTNPTSPTLATRYPTEETYLINDIKKVGDLLYFTSNVMLHILDVSDPAAPVVEATWQNNTYDHLAVTVVDDLIYLGAGEGIIVLRYPAHLLYAPLIFRD